MTNNSGRTADRKLPARAEGLIEREYDGEFVVLNESTQQAHALSGLAADVWRATDGGPMPQASSDDVDTAVAELVELGLLVEPIGFSRRAPPQRAGTVAAAAGVISIGLPEVAAHASVHNPVFQKKTAGSFTVSGL